MTGEKLIVVFGATGAQGLAVIDALLAPQENGQASPYSVRALTRDPGSRRALALQEKGVELIKGAIEDFDAVGEALNGAYGAWVNTDGFTIGEKREIFAAMRIFELAKQVGTIRHFIWSNLDYVSKLANYNPLYRVEHYDGKGRIADWLKAQESDTSENGLTWTSVTTGPYMDMLKIFMFGPIKQRADGTFVFASPVGDGHVPMISLRDVGFFARYAFDNRALVSRQDLEIASEMVTWGGPGGLVDTFTKVTGQRAVYVRQTVDEWTANFANGDSLPTAVDVQNGTSWRTNFSAFWRLWRDDIVKRDMKWIRSIHPRGDTLETWMREHNYNGQYENLLKGVEEGSFGLVLNKEIVDKL